MFALDHTGPGSLTAHLGGGVFERVCNDFRDVAKTGGR